jgi:hypothetical protein
MKRERERGKTDRKQASKKEKRNDMLIMIHDACLQEQPFTDFVREM